MIGDGDLPAELSNPFLLKIIRTNPPLFRLAAR